MSRAKRRTSREIHLASLLRKGNRAKTSVEIRLHFFCKQANISLFHISASQIKIPIEFSLNFQKYISPNIKTLRDVKRETARVGRVSEWGREASSLARSRLKGANSAGNKLGTLWRHFARRETRTRTRRNVSIYKDTHIRENDRTDEIYGTFIGVAWVWREINEDEHGIAATTGGSPPPLLLSYPPVVETRNSARYTRYRVQR